jgi:hypothetical protein
MNPAVPIRGSIIERGQDYAIHRNLIPVQADGRIEWRPAEFTRIAHAMHYLEDAVWRESEDLIEIQPDGTAAALRCPHKACFAPNLDAKAVFQVRMSDGVVFEGAIHSLVLANLHLGARIEIARVRAGVTGQLIPPNQLLYPDAFDGLAADVLLVWRRDRFTQDVILRQCPRLPPGWNPATTRLEVITRFQLESDPAVTCQRIDGPDRTPCQDHALIDFGRMKLVPGYAYPIDALSGFDAPGDSRKRIPVQKKWDHPSQGRYRLTESIRWDLAAPHLTRLPPALASTLDTAPPRAPATPASVEKRIQQVADPASAIEGAGYVIDFIIIPESQVTRFPTGVTFYVQSNYHVSVPVAFEAGTILKFRDNAHLRISGPISFPGELPHAIFTSRNDDLHGEWIGNVPGEPAGSDGNPATHRASEALFIQNQTVDNLVRNVRVRWARTCVRYDGTAPDIAHRLEDSFLEHSDLGVELSVPPSSAVTIRNVRRCNVTRPISGTSYNGTLTDTIINASQWIHHQAEPAIVVRQTRPHDVFRTRLVAVALSRTPLGADQGMIRLISGDGGESWPVRGYIATGADGSDLPRADGDGDPSMVYDSFNNLFLAYRAFGSGGVVCAMSEDDGVHWRKVNGFDGSGFTGATPRLAVSPRLQNRCHLWITVHDQFGALRCASADIRGLGWSSVAGPHSWRWSEPLLEGAPIKFHAIAVGPAGQVIVVATQGTPPETGNRPVTFRTFSNPGGYPSAAFTHLASADFTLANMGFTEFPIAFVDALPVLAWDRVRNVLYLTYTSRAPGAPDSATHIAIRHFRETAGQWGVEVTASPPSTQARFHPWIAVDDSSGHVALAWYDTRDLPSAAYAHLYVATSPDGFRPGGRRHVFRVTSRPASQAEAGYDVKEYIGLAALGGFFYPAFSNNGANGAWDIFSGRLSF